MLTLDFWTGLRKAFHFLIETWKMLRFRADVAALYCVLYLTRDKFSLDVSRVSWSLFINYEEISFLQHEGAFGVFEIVIVLSLRVVLLLVGSHAKMKPPFRHNEASGMSQMWQEHPLTIKMFIEHCNVHMVYGETNIKHDETWVHFIISSVGISFW